MDEPVPAEETVVPVRLTSFVGRAAEMEAISALVADHRLVTICGPGGCGKTSLAGRVAPGAAAALGARVVWVDLGPVPDDAGRIAYAVLAALGIGDLLGMDPVDRIAGRVGQVDTLVVLDNCEHVDEPASKLARQLLEVCPGMRILATSRVPLGGEGETVWRVPPLSIPAAGETDPEAVLATEAGRLFAERGAEALRGWRVDASNAADVAALCARLDGLPLALELAAARVRSLRPDRILAGLDQRFRLLTGGQADALPHQQTLAASVEWSHALLGDLERVLLRRLSVFPGSFALEAAEAIATGELLEGHDILVLLSDLVERSLVTFDGRRYRLAHTIREFAAAAATAAGEDKALRAAHLTYYAALAAAAATELSAYPTVETLDRLDTEYDNLRLAISTALDTGADEAAVLLVADLTIWWQLRGRYAESHVWLGRVLASVPEEPVAGRAWALWGVGQLGIYSMDTPGGFGMAEAAQALEIATAAGDDRLLGRALSRNALFTIFVAPAAAAGQLAEAIAASTRARDGYGTLSGHAYAALAATFGCDDLAAAGPHLAALAAAGVASPYWAAWREMCRGIGLLRAGALADARDALTACWLHADRIGDPMLDAWCSTFLADAHTALGEEEMADAVVARSISIQEDSAFCRYEFVQARRVHAAVVAGDAALAKAVLEPINVVLTTCGIPFVLAEALTLAGRIALLDGDAAAAAAAARATGEAAAVFGTPWYVQSADDLAGRAAAAAGDLAAAEDAQQRVLASCVRHGFGAAGADALEQLAALATRGDSHAEATRLRGAAAALRERTGAVRARADQACYDADLTRLQGALGAGTYADLWEQGRALDLAAAAAYALRARGERKRPATGWASLTPTELAVVDLVAEGLSNAAIAARMFITTATTKSHLHHVFTKLGIANRTQLAAAALARRHEANKPE